MSYSSFKVCSLLLVNVFTHTVTKVQDILFYLKWVPMSCPWKVWSFITSDIVPLYNSKRNSLEIRDLYNFKLTCFWSILQLTICYIHSFRNFIRYYVFTIFASKLNSSLQMCSMFLWKRLGIDAFHFAIVHCWTPWQHGSLISFVGVHIIPTWPRVLAHCFY